MHETGQVWWTISAGFLILGGLVQAVQALLEYRWAFQASVKADAAAQSRRIDDLNSELADRINEEQARAAYLAKLQSDVDDTVDWAKRSLNEVLGTTDVDKYLEEHADEIAARASDIQASMSPLQEPMRARADRVNERATSIHQSSQEFVRELSLRATGYKRRRGWIACGWLTILVGAVLNLVAAVQSM